MAALPAAYFLTVSLTFSSQAVPVLAAEAKAEPAKQESTTDFRKITQLSEQSADTSQKQPGQDDNTPQERSMQNENTAQDQTGQGKDTMQEQPVQGTDGASQEQSEQDTGASQEQSGQNPGTSQEQLGQNPDTSQEQSEQDTGASQEQPGQNPDASQEPTGQGTGASQEQSGQTADTPQEPTGQEPENHESADDDAKEPGEEEPEKAAHVFASVRQAQNTQAASISWKSVPGALAYKVQRSNEKNGKYKNIASLSKSKNKYTDTAAKRGSKYYYRIAAKLEHGGTCYSDILSFSRPLAQVSGVRLVRYSTSSIKVVWDKSKDKQTAYYKVYYAKSKSGDYTLAGTTQNTWYRVKDLANHQDYYFRVKACAAKKSSKSDSAFSKTVTMRTMPYNRTTLFAGDSLMSGLRTYNILNEIAIGGNKGVVAAVGLNTTTFRTRRVFDGKSGLESIISSKPYRVYIMLGDNDIHFRQKEDVIAEYREILKGIRSGSPDTDIVVLAATPVTSTQVAKRSGFAQIPAFNKSLEALAKSMGARYYDCTAFLKDSTGWLKSSYAAGDGVHWKASAYHEFGKLLEAYDQSLD